MLNLGNAWINHLFSCAQTASIHSREVIIASSSFRQVTRKERGENKAALLNVTALRRLASLTPREFLLGYSENTEANRKCEFISHIESNT